MIFAVAFLAMAFAFQPAKGPEKQGVPKHGSAKGATNAENPHDTDQQPPPEPISTISSNTPTESRNPQAEASGDDVEVQRKIEVFTGGLVIVGLLQAGVLVWQAVVFRRTLRMIQRQTTAIESQVGQMIEAGRQTDRLIGTMQDTAQRELRAYVCLSNAVIEFRQERAPEIQIYMKNYGKTPAYEVRWWTHTWIAEWPPRQPLPEPPHNMVLATSLLAPGEKPHAMVTRQNPPIPEHLMPKLGTMELTLYAYGKVTYRDAFGNQRYTRYRLMYGGDEPVVNRDKNGIKVALLKSDYDGNDAD